LTPFKYDPSHLILFVYIDTPMGYFTTCDDILLLVTSTQCEYPFLHSGEINSNSQGFVVYHSDCTYNLSRGTSVLPVEWLFRGEKMFYQSRMLLPLVSVNGVDSCLIAE
jgi:hypothetical protein